MQLEDKQVIMINVAQAKHIVLSTCRVLGTLEIPIEKAVGYCLSASVISSINIPSFRQSSMDGYAIRLRDRNGGLFIQDELPAGTPRQITLLPNAAIKVFTGGPVPEEADTVVPKEQITIAEKSIYINSIPMETGANIRLPGSEINAGNTAIPQGTVIHPMHIGYMASLGVEKIQVIRKPVVAIIITGNELVQPGNTLRAGQVYESNSFALKACLQLAHINTITISYAKDNPAETEKKIAEALTNHDMVLITGGVSVGDYDYVALACTNQGVQQHFHGVKQRPGKPFFFGSKEQKLVFGLPGNPASVLSCYHQYVLPAIHCLSGTVAPEPIKAKLTTQFEKKLSFTFFLKGYFEKETACILPAQASFQLSAFVRANCWIELEETITLFEKGQEIKVHMFA